MPASTSAPLSGLPLPLALTGVPPPLLHAWEAAQTDAARAGALLGLSKHYLIHDLSTSLRLSELALELAVRAGSPEDAVEALLELANITANLNDYMRSLKYCEEALPIIHEHGLNALECRLLNTRALPRVWIGDELGARRDMQRATEIAARLDSPRWLLTSYVNASWICLLCDQPDLSGHYLNLLEEHLGHLTDEGKRAHYLTYLHENRAHTRLEQAREAQRLGRTGAFQEALEAGLADIQTCRTLLDDQPAHDPFWMMLESHQANFLLLRGDLAAAEAHARRALRHDAHLDAGVFPHAHLSLAAVYAAQERWALALDEYRTTLALVRGQGRYRETQKILHAIAQIHERQGNYQAAFEAAGQALHEAQASVRRLTEFEEQQSVLGAGLARTAGLPTPWPERLRLAEQQARQDALTGLLNRRGLDEGLHRLQYEAAPESVLVAFIDVDHFKRVNDEFSHAVGDEVLKGLARLLQERQPAGSLLARYGGEEFVLVVPSIHGDGWALLDGCRAAIAGHDWTPLLAGRTLTVSIGHELGPAGQLPALLRSADEHLYRAKQAGRNRVHPSTSQ